MPSPPTGTVTFLFTDIEGSTQLWESNASAMQSALAQHDRIVREAIERNNGFVFKTVGDAYCAAFSTATDALTAALSAQLALASEHWELTTPLRSRMALHSGAAEERDGDFYGPPLNRVARLLSTGHGGQTLVSAASNELVRDSLPPECSLRDLGDASLKDLARPERVYELQHPALLSQFPPLRALNNPALANNLPQQATSFIGREKEMEDVKSHLHKTRLLTLVGSGGSGKTRLALQAAADLLDGKGDGVWLVELAALVDPSLVPQAVAQALSIKESAGQSIQQTLIYALKSRSLLIVLDNCEHLLAACASLAAALLRSCPTVHLLATSREPLGVAGEQVYRVPSLSMPSVRIGAIETPTAQSLSQYEAVRLFIERAKAVQPSFAVTDQNAPAVAQVCYHLDGIPLAIELAAARVRSLAVEEVNARLDSRFRLLTGGSRDNLPRQQTLRALIDWSYDLLSEQEKSILRLLSIFAGGWTLAAAEALCAGSEDGIESWEALDLLTSLTDKSLVVFDERESSELARYHMLESIRQYGLDRLKETGEIDQVRLRHREYYQLLAEEAERKLAGPDAAAWASRLEADHDNLRSALLWSEEDATGIDAGIALAGSLWRFWQVHSHLSEGRNWLTKALRRRDALESPETLAARSKALIGLGNLALAQSDYAAALVSFEESLEIRRESGDQRGIAASLQNMGNVAKNQGNFATAYALVQESLAIRRTLGDQRSIGYSLLNLGNISNDLGDFAAAESELLESEEILRLAGDEWGVAYALVNQAIVATELTDQVTASRVAQESLEIMRRLGDQRGIAYALLTLGISKNAQGNHADALALLQESLQTLHQIGDQRGIAESLEALADVAFSQEAPERGIILSTASTALRNQTGATLNSRDQQKQQQKMAEARERIGEITFREASAQGSAMSSERAMKFALSDS